MKEVIKEIMIETILILIMLIILFGSITLILIPISNAQCRNFNKMNNTNYSCTDWWWNSESIKLQHAGEKTIKKIRK